MSKILTGTYHTRASALHAAERLCDAGFTREEVCLLAPDGGGLGLHIVQALSEAWGIERDTAAGTHVWAQIAIPAIPRSLPFPS